MGIIIRVMAIVLAGLLSTAQASDPYKHLFIQSFGDFGEDLQTARDEGKKGVFMFFEMEECPFCARMRETVFTRPEVQEALKKHFISLAIDIESDVEITDFDGETMPQKDFAQKKHRVRATPVLAFFDLDGRRVVRYIQATSGVEEFLWLVEYAASEKYREMSFARYKRMKKREKR
jgi:thioredoxin-related protein